MALELRRRRDAASIPTGTLHTSATLGLTAGVPVTSARLDSAMISRRADWSEELVLAAEDLGDRVVGENPADRVRQQVGAAQDADVVRRARPQRDRVGDDDLLEPRRAEVLVGRAAEDRMRRGGEDAG